MAEHRNVEEVGAARALTEAQRAAVNAEVHRILAHSAFKTSRRCVELFQYLIDYAVDGRENGIKERTLGIEVFGRNADYDTNADPIVRRTANEIRKRLAQCYRETYGPHGLRIELVPGSYLPEFRFEGDGHILTTSEPDEQEELPEPEHSRHRPESIHPAAGSGTNAYKWLVGLAAVLVPIAGVWLLAPRFSQAFRSPQYRVWKPLIQSSEPITICLSDLTSVVGKGGAPGAGPNQDGQTQGTAGSNLSRYSSDTPFTDAHVADQISTLLSQFKARSSLQPCSTLTFQDLRQRPAVLVGGSNNPWALDLLANLRYSIRIDPATQDKWIQDAQNPANREWRIDGKLENTDASPDYAVISRFFYKDSGQWIVALSGLEAHGTDAAGQLVADPAFVNYIPSNIPSSGNFQIVLRASVLHGTTGPFQILSVYSW